MAAYGEFAWFYDEFNGEADYQALFDYVHGELEANGVAGGLLADLGCGTGDLTLMLSQAGYDVIGIDRSPEMLSVFREKADELGLSGKVLLLCQDILSMELYGTIRAAVSTFDTFNHIGPIQQFEKAVRQAAFFMEKGGVFLFDLNTPYKHEQILGDNAYTIEAPDARCDWQNHYDPAGWVDMQLTITDVPSENYAASCLLSDGDEAIAAILPTDPGTYQLTIAMSGDDSYTGSGQFTFTIPE